jgi:hypothetical protein
LSAYGVPVYDGKIDGVFTAVKGDGLLVMNYTEAKEPYERDFLMPDGTIRRISTTDSVIYELE